MKTTRLLAGLMLLLLASVPASAEVYDWSQTPSSNSTSDSGSDVQWAEGMAPGDVNDSARAMMAEIRKFIDDLGASATSSTVQTTGGTATAYTLTTEGSADNLENGRIVCALINATNTGASTLNVDSLGAKKIFGIRNSALAGGELKINTIQCLSYDASADTAAGAWVMRGFTPVTTSLEYNATSGALQRSALTGDVSASAGSNTTTIGASKVTSSMIVDGTIVTADIATGGVATADILDGTILNEDIADGTIQAAKLSSSLTGAAVPVGATFDFPGSSCPSLYLKPYGQAINRTTYSELFTVMSTTFGVGDGSTTFNIPDLRGRVTVGEDDMGSVSADRVVDAGADSLNGDTLGDTGGSETETLSEAELAPHTHTGPSHTHTGPSHTHGLSTLFTSTSTDGSHTHSENGTQNNGQAASGSGKSIISADTDTTNSGGSHNHDVDFTDYFTDAGGTGATGASGTGATGSTGSGTPFAKMQPSIVMTKCIYAGV